MKIDILAWNQWIMTDPFISWFRREAQNLRSHADVQMIFPEMGTDPRPDADVVYIPVQHPRVFPPPVGITKPLAVRYHNHAGDDGKDMERLAQIKGLVLANTEHSAARLSALPHVVVNPLTVDYRAYDRPKELGTPVSRDRGTTLLFVGAEKDSSNLEGALKTLAALHDASAMLTIVSDGAKRAHYLGLAYDLGVADQIEWLMSVGSRDLLKLYWRRRVLLHMEHDGSFGLPVLEAALCELPVLVKEGTACSEVGGQYATQIKDADPIKAAATVKDLMKVGVNYQAAFSADARLRVKDCFSDHTESWVHAVESLL